MNSPGIKLRCNKCGYEWTYKGKSKIYATCPQCHRNIMLYNKEESETTKKSSKGIIREYNEIEYNIFKAQIENNATYVDSLKVNDKEIATIVLDDDENVIYILHFDLEFDENLFSDLKKYNILPTIIMCNNYVKMLFFNYKPLNNNPELQMLIDERIKEKVK
jgi:predicted  nucleic acid-binding Zn-ribbon protein